MNAKLAYIGLVVALGSGASACSSSDNTNPSSDAGTGGGATGGGGAGGGTGGTSGGTGGTATTDGGVPSISITKPADNADVTLAAGGTDVDMTLDVKNFVLKAAGGCTVANGKNCGHVHILVDTGVGDGKQCNDVGVPYNSAYPSTSGEPAHAGLDYCKPPITITGNHQITAELHYDDHSPVKDSTGKTISDKVSITVTVASGDGGAKDAGTKD